MRAGEVALALELARVAVTSAAAALLPPATAGMGDVAAPALAPLLSCAAGEETARAAAGEVGACSGGLAAEAAAAAAPPPFSPFSARRLLARAARVARKLAAPAPDAVDAACRALGVRSGARMAAAPTCTWPCRVAMPRPSSASMEGSSPVLCPAPSPLSLPCSTRVPSAAGAPRPWESRLPSRVLGEACWVEGTEIL